jgi:hypothetical protein
MAALGSTAADLPPLMFRRSREDVGDPRRRRHRFAAVRITSAEARLQRLLERYTREVWRSAPAKADGARLAVTILRKRALSSPAAAARSLRRRLELLRTGGVAPTARQLGLFDEDDDADDEVPDRALGAPGLADSVLERRWLAALIEAADGASGVDSKERYLRRLLDRVGDEPVIVFTEYRDTLRQLASALSPSLHLHGGLTASERGAVQARFNDTGGLLLATDAAAEGLNLQQRCRIVVNYELPWNPARLEQRIGRVDRIGQGRAVHAVTLVARDTAEDLVIANLAKRLARVTATLGERDRLGAFLTDARTAGMVMAGAAPDELNLALNPPVVVRLEPAVCTEAYAAADRLSLGRAAAGSRGRRPQGDHRAVLVSTVRASGTLSPGFVVAIRCTARTEDADLIASRVILVHAPDEIVRPAGHAAARSMAAATIALVSGLSDTLPEVAGWFARVTEIHEKSIDSRVARETALHDRQPGAVAVQPGLFDRRAVRAAERLSESQRAIRAEHRRRAAALDRARRLRLSCTPLAVLIAWR